MTADADGLALQIANGGGVQNLALDSIARVISKDYDRRVALHEAGHFLVAYLVGLPPKDYTLSAWSAYQRWVEALPCTVQCTEDKDEACSFAPGSLGMCTMSAGSVP